MPLQLNSYCANVLRTQKPPHVADATQLPEMHDNPTAALGLVFYHGYPLYWPDGHLFGTICILDYFNRPMDENHTQLQQEKNYNHQLMLSLQQSHYNLPQLSDLLANLMQMLQQQMQQSQQQLQLMHSRLLLN